MLAKSFFKGYADESLNFMKAANLVNQEAFYKVCHDDDEQDCEEENHHNNPKFIVDGNTLKHHKWSFARCHSYKRSGRQQSVRPRSQFIIDEEKKYLAQREARLKQEYQNKAEKDKRKHYLEKLTFDRAVQFRKSQLAKLDDKEKGIINNGTAQPVHTTLGPLPSLSLTMFDSISPSPTS